MDGARGECNWPGGDCLSGRGSRGGPDRTEREIGVLKVEDHLPYVK